MKYKLKILSGFGETYHYTIDGEESHKAHYLFNNPDARGSFNNGVAIQGKFIQGIQADWHSTLEYNPDYKMDYVDWNEINTKGYNKKMNYILEMGKKVSQHINENPKLLTMKLSEAIEDLKLPKLSSKSVVNEFLN